MRFLTVILLALGTKFDATAGNQKEHVHFKIYVPEIIKHHIHTKTIFIHVHEPKKKAPKKNAHLESHYNDWSHYSNYNDEGEYDEREEGVRSSITGYDGRQIIRGGRYVHQDGKKNYLRSQEGLEAPRRPPLKNEDSYPHYYRENVQQPMTNFNGAQSHYPANDELDGHPVPIKSVFSNGVVGYSYPPQYEVRENVVEDVPENSHESYADSHEEGHSNRHHSETGHLYSNELNNFYDDKHEESSESISMESKEIDENKARESYRYVGDDYITTRMTML